MRRASVSIMANIAEGFERGGTKEFVHFLTIAKGSAGEVKAHLYVALDQAYITEVEFDEWIKQIEHISRMLGGLMAYLKKSNMKGTKFK